VIDTARSVVRVRSFSFFEVCFVLLQVCVFSQPGINII
jgi:hypothetical protein